MQAGSLAQKRLARGLRLNAPEAIALISSVIAELIRDGGHSVSELAQLGRQMLGTRHVMCGVPSLIDMIHVEGTFVDSTFLVTIHHPIASENGDINLALYSSFLPVPDSLDTTFPVPSVREDEEASGPGALVLDTSGPSGGKITINASRSRRKRVTAMNTGDRPIQVGSHFPFAEINPMMRIDRLLTKGMHLDIPSGTAVRFEPGDVKTVTLCNFGGQGLVTGANGLADADQAALQQRGFLHMPEAQDTSESSLPIQPCTIERAKYVSMYGPTTGDKIHLGDTGLWAKIEKDFTIYGDECKVRCHNMEPIS